MRRGECAARPWSGDKKLLRDYEAEYEGEVSWIKPETQELEMVYRQISAVSPAALETAQGQNMYLRRRFRVKVRKEVSGTGYAAVLS